jgi:hypothetical protein
MTDVQNKEGNIQSIHIVKLTYTTRQIYSTLCDDIMGMREMVLASKNNNKSNENTQTIKLNLQ